MAPHLMSLHQAIATAQPEVADLDPGFLADDESAFLVVEPGVFRDRWFERGELVVVGETVALPGQAVVLVARNLGRPRLGMVRRGGLCGDLGEPCSPLRWMVAGHVRRVYQQVGEGAHADWKLPGWRDVSARLDDSLFDTTEMARLPVGAGLLRPRRPWSGEARPSRSAEQLELFAQAA